MKLFDAHCHLPAVAEAMADTQDDALFPTLGKILERAAAAGVEGLAVCGTSSNDWKNVLELAEKVPIIGNEKVALTLSVGIHPWFVHCRAGNACPERSRRETPPETAPKLRGGYSWKIEFEKLEACLRQKKAAMLWLGIGETGLDLRDQFDNHAEQEACFAAHLELAEELNRPVAIHCVQAWGKMLEILRECPQPKKIMHAYGGSVEMIAELMKLNCWFSFGEAVMNPKFKRAREAAAAAPPQRLLIETDSDGKPEKLVPVARAVAELRGVPVEEIAELTFENAREFFLTG
ncbi:MAG TPA: TatD family hydrolase [Tichowtungia sp.]|nr:TatD family hydrolase [Tichowtungia sp.]